MAPPPLCPGPAPQPDSLTEPNPGCLLSLRAALWQEGFLGSVPETWAGPDQGLSPPTPASLPLATWAPHVLPDAMDSKGRSLRL